MESQKATLMQEIGKLKQEVHTAKQQVNEEKSLKLFTESELRDVESRLKSCETDSDSRITSLKKENSELTSLISKLREQESEMDQQLEDSQLSMTMVNPIPVPRSDQPINCFVISENKEHPLNWSRGRTLQ